MRTQPQKANPLARSLSNPLLARTPGDLGATSHVRRNRSFMMSGARDGRGEIRLSRGNLGYHTAVTRPSFLSAGGPISAASGDPA
jgi:hypothetical protein